MDLALCSIHDAHAPVSEEELKSIFQNHRIEFNRLVLMFRKDEKLHWIYGDGSYDRKVIDQHRGEEYLALLRRARLNNSTIHSSFDEHVSRIETSPRVHSEVVWCWDTFIQRLSQKALWIDLLMST